MDSEIMNRCTEAAQRVFDTLVAMTEKDGTVECDDWEMCEDWQDYTCMAHFLEQEATDVFAIVNMRGVLYGSKVVLQPCCPRVVVDTAEGEITATWGGCEARRFVYSDMCEQINDWVYEQVHGITI